MAGSLWTTAPYELNAIHKSSTRSFECSTSVLSFRCLTIDMPRQTSVQTIFICGIERFVADNSNDVQRYLRHITAGEGRDELFSRPLFPCYWGWWWDSRELILSSWSFHTIELVPCYPSPAPTLLWGGTQSFFLTVQALPPVPDIRQPWLGHWLRSRWSRTNLARQFSLWVCIKHKQWSLYVATTHVTEVVIVPLSPGCNSLMLRVSNLVVGIPRWGLTSLPESS